MNESFEEFAARARADGYDEVTTRSWAPLTVVETHTHPFAVRARVVEGEMWLDCGQTPRHLRPGDDFVLDREVAHAERYGPQGASYWVARRNHPD